MFLRKIVIFNKNLFYTNLCQIFIKFLCVSLKLLYILLKNKFRRFYVKNVVGAFFFGCICLKVLLDENPLFSEWGEF